MRSDFPSIDLDEVVKRYWLALLILPAAVTAALFLQSQQTQPAFSATLLLQPPPAVANAVGEAVRDAAIGVTLTGLNTAMTVSAEGGTAEGATAIVSSAYPAILTAASSAVDAEIANTRDVLYFLDRELAAPSDVSNLVLAFDRAPGFRDRIAILEDWKADAAAMTPQVSVISAPMSLALAAVLWGSTLVVTFVLLAVMHTFRRRRSAPLEQ